MGEKMRLVKVLPLLMMTLIIVALTEEVASQPQWWNNSWAFRIPVTIVNPTGYDYKAFPIEVVLSDIPKGHITSVKEIKVLLFDGSRWILVPSQAYGAERYEDGSIKSVRVILLVDIPAGKSKTYYIYYGNPVAEPVGGNEQFKWWTKTVGQDKYLYLENSLIRVGVRKTGTAGIASAWVVGGSGVDLIGGGAGRHWYYSHFYEDSWHDNGEVVEESLSAGSVAIIYKYATTDAAALRYETWLYLFADKNFIKAVINVKHVKDKPVLNPSGHKPMFEYSIVPHRYDDIENTTTYVQLYSTELKEGIAIVLDNNPPYAPSTISYGPWDSNVRINCDWRSEITLAPKRSLTLCRYLIIYRVDDPRHMKAEDLDKLVAYPPIVDVGPEEASFKPAFNLVKISLEEAKAVMSKDVSRIELKVTVENRGLKQGEPITLHVYAMNITDMSKLGYQAKEIKAPSGKSTEKIELTAKPSECIVYVIATYSNGWSNPLETRVVPIEATEEAGQLYNILIIVVILALIATIAAIYVRRRK